MLRSFDYAAAMALARVRDSYELQSEEAREKALAWRDTTRGEFLAAYLETLGASAPAPELTAQLLDLFTLQKAIYEIGYELSNRPGWVRIPLAGVMDVLADARGVTAWLDAARAAHPDDAADDTQPTGET
jgi:maltose alpha-D-glucosyltransferase/alpha-amylase